MSIDVVHKDIKAGKSAALTSYRLALIANDSYSPDTASVGVGTFLGTEFTANLGNYPYPSSEGVGCDKCHMVESNMYLIVKDLFLKYYAFGIGGPEPEKIVLLTFSYKLLLVKLCLFSLDNFVACDDRCCPPGVICGADKKCQAPGLCLSGCCGNEDCVPPSECKPSTKQIQSSLRHRILADSQCLCPYECCGDGDCKKIVGEFCDGVTHQCTNENHVSILVCHLLIYLFEFDPINHSILRLTIGYSQAAIQDCSRR